MTPPTRWRSEWQPKLYPASRQAFTSMMSEPSPIPNCAWPVAGSLKMKLFTAPVIRKTLKMSAK